MHKLKTRPLVLILFFVLPLSYQSQIGFAIGSDKHNVGGTDLFTNKETLVKYKTLTKDSLIQDIDLLYQALTEMHPGLYRYNSESQIQALFQDLKKSLADRESERVFMIKLAQTVAQIRCGHTYVNPWNMSRGLRERMFGAKIYFPIGFNIINGQFIATENASDEDQLKRGAEILEINRIPVADIYQKLKTIAKSDGNNFNPVDQYLSLENYEEKTWQAFDLYFSLFFPLNSPNYEIKFRNYGEKKSQYIRVAALDKKERAGLMREKYGNKITEKENWSLRFVEDLAVIRLGTFAIWNWKDFDQKKWFEESFQSIKDRGINRLAIDIRGNGGGLSEPANELISYLIKDSLKCEEASKVYIKTTKFNPELLPFIDTWVEVLKTGLPEQMYRKAENGQYELLESTGCEDIAPKENRYRGEVYIFGDASNVSATYTLLAKAKQFEFATVIGQTSGGNQQGINGGEYAFFYLPYSKMEVDIPLKYFAPASPKEDAGVEPDIRVEVKQSDIAFSNDPFIEYLLEK